MNRRALALQDCQAGGPDVGNRVESVLAELKG